MKVLFTHSYFLKLDPKQFREKNAYPPLATIYAAALLRENGFEVSFSDSMFQSSGESILQKLEAQLPKVMVIYDDSFNYLTKMCLLNMQQQAFKMISLAKEKGVTVIVHSSDASDHCEKYLNAGADFIILGEGEISLLELLNALKKGSINFETIPGLAYRNGEKTITTPKRAVMRQLDSLPQPAWDLIDIETYRETWLKKKGYFSLNLSTTRGCPYKCNWCAKPIYGNRYNVRSPQKVVEELELLVNGFKAGHIWFTDDIFGLKPGWLQEFSELVGEKGLKFNYSIQTRADLLLKENAVENLARSGCTKAWIGAESGSQKILDAMDKGITVEQVYQSVKLLKEHKIHAALFLQFGYLGETEHDISATLKMLKDTMPDDIGVSVSYPLPGTGFYEKVKSDLKLKTNWTDSDELALMFKNNQSSAYYRRLHKYVHKVLRRSQGIESTKNLLTNPSLNTLKKSLKLLYYIPASIYDKLMLGR